MALAEKVQEVSKRVSDAQEALPDRKEWREKQQAIDADAEHFTELYDDEEDEDKKESYEDVANDLGELSDKLEKLDELLDEIDDICRGTITNLKTVKVA